MRKILIIGIGAGNIDHVTIQAIDALKQVDVVFVPDKGSEKKALRKLRLDICTRYGDGHPGRFVDVPVPQRASDPADYGKNVAQWHAQIEANYHALLSEELGENECGAFLVWGDPALYDSTLRIIKSLRAKGLAFDYEVIPGVTSVQALAARHRIPLNRIGESVLITTGRKLAEGWSDAADSVVVLLDGNQAFKEFVHDDIDIYWGAYVGTDEEILIAGKLAEVASEIEVQRARAREKNGWIMDAYLLRRAKGPNDR
jgi:precorrin-6A synthase